MKKCPFCAEEILDEAIKCKHCGSMLVREGESFELEGFSEPRNKQAVGEPVMVEEKPLQTKPTKEKFKDFANLSLGYLLGALFILISIGMLFDNPFLAMAPLTIAFLVLPPVRRFVHSKTNLNLQPKIKMAIVLLIIGAWILIPLVQSSKQAKEIREQARQEKELQEAKENEQLAKYFRENKIAILEQINSYIKNKEFKVAKDLAWKYALIRDSEIEKLRETIDGHLIELEKMEATKEVLAKLRNIPVEKYAENRDLYKQLIELNPSNEKYKSKHEFYRVKAIEEEAKRARAAQRKERIENQFSSWDGSHRYLERAIKQTMNDPKSYEHVETVYWDRGDHLVVKTTFRGKNAFGGIVVNWVKAKVDLNGNVLNIIESYP